MLVHTMISKGFYEANLREPDKKGVAWEKRELIKMGEQEWEGLSIKEMRKLGGGKG